MILSMFVVTTDFRLIFIIASYNQHIPAGSYTEKAMPATTEQAVVMLASHFYESRDGSTGGFFADNPQAATQVWNTVNLLLRLDREWKV
nr:MAG TPA: tail connector protein [Caudoviricetes sp.]